VLVPEFSVKDCGCVDIVGAPAITIVAKDEVVVFTLQPGAYTVQASSASGIAGVTLIEVYEVPMSF